ncbi:helix-turn-helix domain-containing protein [Microbacterium sp. KKR3/1]|uniref:helix-turn-helix domain-containing protein n=1 Tax=Microbacterium sp. KKR3/1 TaxID=2904241 RepID=UPI001E313300|nr:helix-turn-helix domain-containing protein [Microbacterium sp. KKR3/1]MCE0510610.1 helix-turn-helix domain-containing protein [Microbacterium sp. KKR3/1]
MPEPKEWVTAKEAAALIGRHVSQVYRWIDAGRLATRARPDGVTVVLSKAVLRIEPSVRRGRPRGAVGRR